MMFKKLSQNYIKLKYLFPAILIYYKIEMIGIKTYKNWNNRSDKYWYNIEIRMID